MPETGTDADETDTGEDTAGNPSEGTDGIADAETIDPVESDATVLQTEDGSDGGDGDSDAEVDASGVDEQGEIGAGFDIDDDGDQEITLTGRGPLQTVLVFLVVLFVVDVAFNGAAVTTTILDLLAGG